jgi:hypothetical protein
MELFGIATVPIITAVVWIVCYLVKLWVPNANTKIIPTVATVLGIILGLITVSLNLTGAVIGAASGLAATGANELAKLFRQDTVITAPEADEDTKAVADATKTADATATQATANTASNATAEAPTETSQATDHTTDSGK